MNLSGWVPMRRGIVAHLINRSLSVTEYAVLSVLILLANKETGGYTINVPTLRYFIPELSEDAADRALRSLQRKRYVYRKITPRSTIAYPYWIDGFEVTSGRMRARRVDLSQVFATDDPSKLRYVDRADIGAGQGADASAGQGADASADQGADEGADYNDKDKGQGICDKDTSSIPITQSVSTNASVGVPDDDRECSAAQSMSESRTQSECANECVQPTPAPPLCGAGLRWSGNVDIGYIDITTGKPVESGEAHRRIRERVGLFWEDGEFLDSRGHRVKWDSAQARISGGKAA